MEIASHCKECVSKATFLKNQKRFCSMKVFIISLDLSVSYRFYLKESIKRENWPLVGY